MDHFKRPARRRNLDSRAYFTNEKEFPEIKYAIITPFLEQEKNWNEQKQANYQSLLVQADFQTSVTKKPYEAPWQFIEKINLCYEIRMVYSLSTMKKMKDLRSL